VETPPSTPTPKKIQTKNPAEACPSWSDLSISWAPRYPISLDSPFRGRGKALSGLQRRRFLFPGRGSGGAFQVAGAPDGQGQPGEGRWHHVLVS